MRIRELHPGCADSYLLIPVKRLVHSFGKAVTLLDLGVGRDRRAMSYRSSGLRASVEPASIFPRAASQIGLVPGLCRKGDII
jgi:hypothetical protein